MRPPGWLRLTRATEEWGQGLCDESPASLKQGSLKEGGAEMVANTEALKHNVQENQCMWASGKSDLKTSFSYLECYYLSLNLATVVNKSVKCPKNGHPRKFKIYLRGLYDISFDRAAL